MSLRAVLTYHSLDVSGSPISVAPDAFAGHVRFLAARSIRVLPLDELLEEVHSGRDEGDAVAITFDDGFANLLEIGAPMMREHGLPATVFIVPGHVGGTNDWGGRHEGGIPALPLLDWDALGRLSRDGFTVGAHTRTHPRLDTLAADQLVDEIRGGAEDIQHRLGMRPSAFAYPYGIAPAAAVAEARREYAFSLTTRLSVLNEFVDSALVPRVDAYYFGTASALNAWGTPQFRAYLGLRAAGKAVRAMIQ